MAKTSRSVHAILGFLTWRPMSGYDIKQAIEGSISNFWSESFGQIYPILKRLAADGLAVRKENRTAGGRIQNEYSITAKGRRELERWLIEPAAPELPRNELLLKLFFGQHTAVAESINKITDRRAELVAQYEKYEGIASFLRRERREIADLPYWLITLNYGFHSRKAEIAWCDETLAVLGELADSTPTAKIRSRRKK